MLSIFSIIKSLADKKESNRLQTRRNSLSVVIVSLECPPNRYPIPLNRKIIVIRTATTTPTTNATANHAFITTPSSLDPEYSSKQAINPYESAYRTRHKFVKLYRNYHQKTSRYMYYYEKALLLEPLYAWMDRNGIYLKIVAIEWLFLNMYLLFDVEINHLTIINHIGGLGILFTIVVYGVESCYQYLAGTSRYLFYSTDLEQVFDCFLSCEGALIDFILLSGKLLASILVYTKCISTQLISYWWITTIPLWIACILSSCCAYFHYRQDTSGWALLDLLLESYVIIIVLIVPFLFALYYDDPVSHYGIKDTGYMVIALFPLFFAILIGDILFFLACISTIFVDGCRKCQSLAANRSDVPLEKVNAVVLLLLTIVLNVITNLAIVGFSVSCFFLNNDQWDRKIWFGEHFTPLVYALWMVAGCLSVLMCNDLVQKHTAAFRSENNNNSETIS